MSKPARHFTADWFTAHAAAWLTVLQGLRGQPVAALEIGSYEGRSACWLMDNIFTHPQATLTCVDTWDGDDPCLKEKTLAAEMRFDGNVKEYGGRLIKVKMPSIRFLSEHINRVAEYDFIFIDGCHEGYAALTDLLLSWELLRPGGWIASDDYQWQSPLLRTQPKDAWDAFVGIKPPGIAEVLPVGRSMFARKAA